MVSKKKQKYLVPKNQMVFLKDLGSNKSVYSEYGWKNTGTLFKSHLLSYGIEFVREELDQETKPDGTVVKTTYGIERIPDPMLIKEMQEYADGVNVDRLVSFVALVSFIRIQESNRGYTKEIIRDDAAKKLQKSENLFKLNSSPFSNIGTKNGKQNKFKKRKNPYKNLR